MASPTPLSLTLRDAIDRGLKTNLGLLLSGQASETARGERLRVAERAAAASHRGGKRERRANRPEDVRVQLSSPRRFATPTIVGPFHYTDVRAYASWNVFDYSLRKNYRAAKENERAAQLSFKDARDLVVQAMANAYLQIIADSSRVEAIRAQVETAQALYDRTADQKRAGTAAGIDVLRSQVELKQQQQRLLAQKNQFDKDKLALGRVIGLPPGQEFQHRRNRAVLAADLDDARIRPCARLTHSAPIIQSYQATRARGRGIRSGRARRALPEPAASRPITATSGPTLDNSHGTFTFSASAKFNLFDGGRISGDVIQAQAALKQRQDELADLGGQIDYQVRAAFLDIRTAADQVAVARTISTWPIRP